MEIERFDVRDENQTGFEDDFTSIYASSVNFNTLTFEIYVHAPYTLTFVFTFTFIHFNTTTFFI